MRTNFFGPFHSSTPLIKQVLLLLDPEGDQDHPDAAEGGGAEDQPDEGHADSVADVARGVELDGIRQGPSCEGELQDPGVEGDGHGQKGGVGKRAGRPRETNESEGEMN